MRVCLLQLIERLNDLRAFIDGIEKQAEILRFDVQSTNPTKIESLLIDYQTHFYNFSTKRVFDYKTIIITLYGCLENYVENLLKAYLTRISYIISNYADLPLDIRENHYRQSAELLLKLDYPKYRGVVTRETVIGNMHSCINTPTSYKLNIDAFTNHSSNFRSSSVNEFFSVIGISGISSKVKSHPKFVEFFSAIGPEVDLHTTKDDIIFEVLEDIAFRRNNVAHGVEGNIASIEILRSYIRFVELYATCLNDVIFLNMLQYEVEFNSIHLNSPIAVYSNHIICLSLENTAIKVGDIIVAETQNPSYPFLYGNIKCIQVNKNSISELAPEPIIEVGIEVEFNAKDNHKFHLIKK